MKQITNIRKAVCTMADELKLEGKVKESCGMALRCQ